MLVSCLFYNAAALINLAWPVVYLLSMGWPHLICTWTLMYSSAFPWWSVRQSDTAAKGIRVTYTSGIDPTCMIAGWHTPTSEAVNVWTQVCECCASITAPSSNLRFISKQRTRDVMRGDGQWMDPLTMMRPVVMGSLQPWHSSPNLAQ